MIQPFRPRALNLCPVSRSLQILYGTLYRNPNPQEGTPTRKQYETLQLLRDPACPGGLVGAIAALEGGRCVIRALALRVS